ncbi:Transposase IS66 family protein [Planctomycetes bacterium Pla86]|uniref:Transposase IS66 family protein n=1 Tax=Engelhardtia mirabilis TaxID=2528011 RepID=A0A518BS88_9BACT|nr:Transposase IS66 family protein [Planctomycetes bacterium Pla133]QDV04160.1 Transposase IS66 family protein [Planctomycetes bacterium Pla86]
MQFPRATHLPLHRQEVIFERHGYALSRSTMCDWVGACAEPLFPVVQVMRERILASGYVNADETPVLMQTNFEGGGKQCAWLWGYADRDGDVVYDFRTSRGRDGPL